MNITKTKFDGLLVIEPRVFEDDRGYFYESYNIRNMIEKGLHHVFVQDNESKSKKNVVRGFHYQIAPYAQTKLVRVMQGEVLDVVIDLRKDQATFGQAFSIRLSGENKKQLLIPKGFAHGFLSLEDDTVFAYKCDNFYSGEHERAINVLDESIFDDWGIAKDAMILSEKDKRAPLFKDAVIF